MTLEVRQADGRHRHVREAGIGTDAPTLEEVDRIDAGILDALEHLPVVGATLADAMAVVRQSKPPAMLQKRLTGTSSVPVGDPFHT